MAEALMLAALLHRPAGLVDAVWQAGGLDAVAVVENESQFNDRCWRREPRGHTSWGLFQIDDEFHEQHREDLLLHIVEGVRFLNECKSGVRQSASGDVSPVTADARPGNLTSFCYAIARYNGSLVWGKYVERRRDSWALWLYRHLR